MKYQIALKIKACTKIWATQFVSKLIIKTDFAVVSCLSMTLICAQPCLKRVSLETEF